VGLQLVLQQTLKGRSKRFVTQQGHFQHDAVVHELLKPSQTMTEDQTGLNCQGPGWRNQQPDAML
jgi:hypothetical protein